jgi:hypothetical protein
MLKNTQKPKETFRRKWTKLAGAPLCIFNVMSAMNRQKQHCSVLKKTSQVCNKQRSGYTRSSFCIIYYFIKISILFMLHPNKLVLLQFSLIRHLHNLSGITLLVIANRIPCSVRSLQSQFQGLSCRLMDCSEPRLMIMR